MSEIWISLTPILIADVVNPALFAAMVYAAGSARPIINSSAILLGHTIAYFSAGILLALGLAQISERLAHPRLIDFIIELLIGILLLWAAYRSVTNTTKAQPTNIPELTPIKAMGYGIIINFIGIPFALPYFAALDQILKADLSTLNALILLVAYNILYALPFMLVPVLIAISSERSQSTLQRINDVVDRASRYLMPALLALIGLVMVSDAVSFLTTGKALF